MSSYEINLLAHDCFKWVIKRVAGVQLRFARLIYIKACVQNKAQLCASSACISGYVLSDKEQNENINKQLCWINLATVVAGLMKSKLTESQHIDICKPINLLNKKWGDKNPPQTTKLNI